MLIYIIKSSVCLAIFMLFYKFFLEKTSAHTFKRFFLIGVILISIVIPFISFTQYTEVEIFTTNTEINPFPNVEVLKNSSLKDYFSIVLWSTYTLGVILFLFRFFKNLYQLIKKIKANPKFENQNFINVLLNDLMHPYTFFNYIFLNKTKYEHNLIPKEVLLHEQTHANQKHSLDILLIEVLLIIFWFNPLLYFLKRDIKLNHEFLADQAVLNHGFTTSKYQQVLLAFSSNAQDHQLANAINYSLIKKRFTVMKTQTSKKAIWLRSFIILPLLAILIYSFSNKTIIEKEAAKEQSIYQQEATKKQLAEYNSLAKKYNAQPEDKRVVKLKELQRIEYLFGLMTNAQKANAEPFPNCPPPPPAPKPPKVIEVTKVPSPPKTKNVTKMPPPPKSPLDYIIYMTKKGASFQFNGNKISSDKAIELLKKNKSLNISTNTNNDLSVVKIQTKPITH